MLATRIVTNLGDCCGRKRFGMASKLKCQRSRAKLARRVIDRGVFAVYHSPTLNVAILGGLGRRKRFFLASKLHCQSSWVSYLVGLLIVDASLYYTIWPGTRTVVCEMGSALS